MQDDPISLKANLTTLYESKEQVDEAIKQSEQSLTDLTAKRDGYRVGQIVKLSTGVIAQIVSFKPPRDDYDEGARSLDAWVYKLLVVCRSDRDLKEYVVYPHTVQILDGDPNHAPGDAASLAKKRIDLIQHKDGLLQEISFIESDMATRLAVQDGWEVGMEVYYAHDKLKIARIVPVTVSQSFSYQLRVESKSFAKVVDPDDISASPPSKDVSDDNNSESL